MSMRPDVDSTSQLSTTNRPSAIQATISMLAIFVVLLTKFPHPCRALFSLACLPASKHLQVTPPQSTAICCGNDWIACLSIINQSQLVYCSDLFCFSFFSPQKSNGTTTPPLYRNYEHINIPRIVVF